MNKEQVEERVKYFIFKRDTAVPYMATGGRGLPYIGKVARTGVELPSKGAG